MNNLFEAIAEKNLEKTRKLCNGRGIHTQKLIDHMIQFYMTKNLWVLQEIINNIDKPFHIATLMIHIDKKPLIIKVKNFKTTIDLKDMFYMNIASRSNVKESLMIIAYFAAKKKYEFCNEIINFLLEQESKNDIKEYIKVCKTLYDHNPCKHRINLIYYAVYVYITEQVNYIPFTLEKPSSSMDYLFVYLERDEILEEQVEHDREIYQKKSDPKIPRIINVTNL